MKLKTKKKERLNLTKDEMIKCNGIIHSASVAAGGAGIALAQVPLADTAVITPIQITMVTSLGAVFEVKVTEALAKSIIASLATAFVGRGIAQVLVGWIPGVGNFVNTTTAAGLTEALGWVAVKYFKDGKYNEYNWFKEGYVKASNEYKEKFKNQAKNYEKCHYDAKSQKKEYEELLNEHEKYIKELLNKINRTEKENKLLKEMMEMQQILKNIENIKYGFKRLEEKSK